MNYGGLLATQQHLILEFAEELGFSAQKSVHVITFEGA
jgi:hypothetical protein